MASHPLSRPLTLSHDEQGKKEYKSLLSKNPPSLQATEMLRFCRSKTSLPCQLFLILASMPFFTYTVDVVGRRANMSVTTSVPPLPLPTPSALLLFLLLSSLPPNFPLTSDSGDLDNSYFLVFIFYFLFLTTWGRFFLTTSRFC